MVIHNSWIFKLVELVSVPFILYCVINFDKIMQRNRKNHVDYFINLPEKESKKMDELLRSVNE